MTQLHSLGMHANHMARHTDNERMQAILQWVGVGSIIMMGAAAAVHLIKDLTHSIHEKEPYPRDKYMRLKDDLDRHYRAREGQGR